jgi:hypothetical protein
LHINPAAFRSKYIPVILWQFNPNILPTASNKRKLFAKKPYNKPSMGKYDFKNRMLNQDYVKLLLFSFAISSHFWERYFYWGA